MKKLAILLAVILAVLLFWVVLNPTDSDREETQPTETNSAGAEVTEPSETDAPAGPAELTVPTETESTEPPLRELTVVIDAGHQKNANYGKEPVGPGSEEMKNKVASGTQGVATGLPEYELNLRVALKLQAILEARGYSVVMIRTTNDVDISNAERAQIANALNADIFVRIHANGAEDSSVRGAMTLCQTPQNPYNGDLYQKSRLLADCILEEMVAETGFKKQSVWETDTMSGINWCRVPVTIVEMGYMSNPEEDRLMATEECQNNLAQGIADGIDKYFLRLDTE